MCTQCFGLETTRGETKTVIATWTHGHTEHASNEIDPPKQSKKRRLSLIIFHITPFCISDDACLRRHGRAFHFFFSVKYQHRTLVSESCETRAALCCWTGAKADVDAARARMLATAQVFMVVCWAWWCGGACATY